MALILENYSLKNLNTFEVAANARWFTEIDNLDDLQILFNDDRWKDVPRLILGGGSNMLFTNDFEGLVVKVNLKGINHLIDGSDVLLTAGAGEVWNDVVKYAVDREFSGIENLSLIPGSVGASPIQNIGAYGVEIKDVFHQCKAFDLDSGLMQVFNLNDCKFSYRDSVFKSKFRGKYLITEVTYRLFTELNLNTSYGAIQAELEKRRIYTPTVTDISQVVSHIRLSKLPDPTMIGNAGSFFKNPIVSKSDYNRLIEEFPDLVSFKLDESTFKLAAGWLIEQCGWKGMVCGHTGTWKNQALVLVNHGDATGKEIFDFSHKIIESVKLKYGVILEREVNII